MTNGAEVVPARCCHRVSEKREGLRNLEFSLRHGLFRGSGHFGPACELPLSAPSRTWNWPGQWCVTYRRSNEVHWVLSKNRSLASASGPYS
jgi:hypothetical protein